MATKIAVFWDVVQSGRTVLTLQRSLLPQSTGEPSGSIHLVIFVDSLCPHGPVACKNEIE